MLSIRPPAGQERWIHGGCTEALKRLSILTTLVAAFFHHEIEVLVRYAHNPPRVAISRDTTPKLTILSSLNENADAEEDELTEENGAGKAETPQLLLDRQPDGGIHVIYGNIRYEIADCTINTDKKKYSPRDTVLVATKSNTDERVALGKLIVTAEPDGPDLLLGSNLTTIRLSGYVRSAEDALMKAPEGQVSIQGSYTAIIVDEALRELYTTLANAPFGRPPPLHGTYCITFQTLAPTQSVLAREDQPSPAPPQILPSHGVHNHTSVSENDRFVSSLPLLSTHQSPAASSR